MSPDGSGVLLTASWITIASFGFVITVFTLYFLFVLRRAKVPAYLAQLERTMNLLMKTEELPVISIIIPAHNEEGVIETKLNDVAEMDYPHEKREVIVVDDASTDQTRLFAERTLRRLNLQGRVVTCESRTGVNGCYNRGFNEAKGAFIVTTDADVTVDHDALLKSIKVIENLPNVGGVTSRMEVISSGQTNAARFEKPYREFYDRMSIAESAIHSTFPGYTNFAMVRRSAFPTMPLDYGSTDGNISLAIVRKGLRYVCVPSIIFHEPIVVKVKEQMRQKTRRGARQIQAAFTNLDILFSQRSGMFGRLIFPLRLLMMISPLFSVLGLVALTIVIVYVSMRLLPIVPLVVVCLYLASKRSRKFDLLWSFLIHEYYLLIGLLYSTRRGSSWRTTQRSSITPAGVL